MTGTVGVIVLVNLETNARARGFVHLALGRLTMLGTPGLRFAKILGSGSEGGFLVHPSFTHQGLFATFDNEANADAFLASRHPILDGYRRYSRELFSAKLRAYASRGQWSGRQPLSITASVPTGPMASLTRASIRPLKASRFWRHAPPSEASLRAVEGCMVAAGLGEMPLFRQATFTIWESEAAMERYARGGAHLSAIQASYAQGFFSESMFARFVPDDMRGTWAGRTWPSGA